MRWLRAHPTDFRGALLRTEPRWRGLQVFAYQSWLWNEGVKQYLKDVVGMQHLVAIRYQAGTLLFPSELDAEGARLLQGPDLPAARPGDAASRTRKVERAALSVLDREDMKLADLAVPRHARDPLRARGAAPRGLPRPARRRRGEARTS